MTKEEALRECQHMGTGYRLGKWSDEGLAWLERQPQRNYWAGVEWLAIFQLADGLVAVFRVTRSGGRMLPAVHPRHVEYVE